MSHFLGGVGGNLRVTREAWRLLESYPWPGNVRELRAEVMRWHVFCDRWVRPEDLDLKFTSSSQRSPGQHIQARPQALADAVAEAERAAITAALTEAGGNLSRTARLLKIDRNTLKRSLAKLGIDAGSRPSGRPAAEW